MSEQLQQSASVTLDGSGNGTVFLGPNIVREFWTPDAVSVVTSPNTTEAQCFLYLGNGPTPGNQLGATFTGSTGDTCAMAGFDLRPGQSIIAKWVGGTPGAVATVTVFGKKGRYSGRN